MSMKQINATEKAARPAIPTRRTGNELAGTFPMRVGKTTYVVGVHFSKDCKDTLEDKLKRLICEDVKAGSF